MTEDNSLRDNLNLYKRSESAAKPHREKRTLQVIEGAHSPHTRPNAWWSGNTGIELYSGASCSVRHRRFQITPESLSVWCTTGRGAPRASYPKPTWTAQNLQGSIGLVLTVVAALCRQVTWGTTLADLGLTRRKNTVLCSKVPT